MMHDGEQPVTEDLVRRLLRAQFPEWADLTLSRVAPSGTVNAVFRLGEHLSVRLARLDGPSTPGGTEFEWLAQIAARLPVKVPTPVAQGRPAEGYPWYWGVHGWVDGETVPVEATDVATLASDLAATIRALWSLDPEGAPQGRGIPLAERAPQLRRWFDSFDGPAEAEDVWADAVAAPPWPGPPRWHHGDLDVRNWVLRDGRLSGVLDWEAMGVGDPACDVMVAWKLHSRDARDVVREALAVDDATWRRARGWVVSQAVAILAYYTPDTNRVLVEEASRWLELALDA